jgi:glycosyltransferase involved in cell wall biosynthesis
VDRRDLGDTVSVGIPTYNRPEFLKRALEIITGQTYQNLEIIISDNASSDQRVKEVVDEFMQIDSRIIYFRQDENIGVLANAAFVLKKARGKYFTWVSDDDWRSPEFIELLVEQLEIEPEVNFAFCEYHEVYEDGNRAEGYPSSHLKMFKPFQSKSRMVRTISYYWQNAKNGKPNLFYSLFRKDALSQVDIKKITDNYLHLNMDCLISFSLLQKGRVAIRSEAMCALMCGNKKHYLDEAEEKKSNQPIILKLWSFFKFHKNDKDLYIKSTNSQVERISIAILFYLKVLFLASKLILEKADLIKRNPGCSRGACDLGHIEKIKLSNVTLVALATRNVEETLQALIYSCRDIEFGSVKLLSHFTPYGLEPYINFSRIEKIKSIDDWSYKVIYDLNSYIDTEFALLVHADGFVVNSSSWKNEFLEYDYIGAPWPLPTDNFSYRDVNSEIVRVGNSVSLRSKRLLELPIKLRLPWEPYCGSYNEDGFICVKNKHIYEAYGMRFAPLDVAKYFSHEVMIPEVQGINPFVFHKWAGTNSQYPKFK